MGQIGAVAIRDLNKLFLDLIMGNRLLFLEHYRPKKKKKKEMKKRKICLGQRKIQFHLFHLFSLSRSSGGK